MKSFKLTIFKGHQNVQEKIVTASSLEELQIMKNRFWIESTYKKNTNGNWMGVKRIA